MADLPPEKPDWTRRWIMIRAILGFCALMIAWVVIAGANDRLRETALLGLLSLAGAVGLGYLGFATQDDLNWLRQHPRPRAAAPTAASREAP